MSKDDVFPDKPKGMHWRTYERLRRQHDALEYEIDVALAEWIGCTFGRYQG